MLWILNLATLGLLGVFSLVYLSSSIKAPAMEKAMTIIRPLVDTLAVVSVLLGIIAACAMPMLMQIPKYMFIYMIANVILVVVAMPYMLHKFEKQLEGKTNAAILAEIRNSLSFITDNEKIFGIVCASACGGILVAFLGII